jgi:hypothetical protein
MDEAAGFGSPVWLPLSVRRAQAAEARAEAQQARVAERALAERAEARRSADLAMFASEAEARGEYVDPMALATGLVTGRSLADVLESARLASECEDARAETEERRRRGERLQFMGALEDPAARTVPVTATRRAIERTSERFAAAVTSQRQADAARGQLENLIPRLHRPWRRGR